MVIKSKTQSILLFAAMLIPLLVVGFLLDIADVSANRLITTAVIIVYITVAAWLWERLINRGVVAESESMP